MSFNNELLNLLNVENIPTFLRNDPKLIPKSTSEIEFFSKIKSYMNFVNNYENIELQEKTRNLIPWKEMTIKAINKMLKIKEKHIKENKNDKQLSIDSRDILLIDILEWFKNDFFKWFDSPLCNNCKIEIKDCKQVMPTNEELRWSANTVELYVCNQCGQQIRFARYNNPEKLLETRIGRCGEWANTFTMLCRSLNYDSRLIVDWSDHVWTEVYSDAQKRWLHCDPCENICDSPLVYEMGWNKKLTFCIGFAYNEVQDVSWRYSNDHKQLQQRRALLCREEWIANLLNKITDNLQLVFTNDMKQQLKIRRLLEWVEFTRVPNQSNDLKDNELQGRHSGSKEWRLNRRETSIENNSPNYKFQIKDSSINPILITYNCSTNEYKFNGKTFKDWRTCVFEFDNIMRKVEHDWKMVYLSRLDSSSNHELGRIKWILNFESDIKWSQIKICFNDKVYENGCIRLNLYSNSPTNGLELKTNEENIINRSQIPNNNNELTIEAIFSGGNGSNGWQHSQLFRQSLNSELDLNSFVIKILF